MLTLHLTYLDLEMLCQAILPITLLSLLLDTFVIVSRADNAFYLLDYSFLSLLLSV
jgi:hypothetical protein